MATKTAKQIKRELIDGRVDPFLIAAEAIERSERLMAQVMRLEKVLSQVPELSTRGQYCSGSCLLH